MNNHEEAFIKSFVRATRQERFLSFLSNFRKRQKFINEFNHLRQNFLAPEFLAVLTGKQSLPPSVYDALRKLGAPERCWVMGGRYDAEERELLEALEGSGDGFVLSCIPGKLAYLKTEDDEYILHRGSK